MNVVITDDLLMLKCYLRHLHASQILKPKSKYLCPFSSLMFHLALFPCKQSPRSTSQHPNWALRNRQALQRAAEEGENKPKHVLLWPPRTALPCHAMPCHARLRQAGRLSPLPSVALGLCQPCPCFFLPFFTPPYYIDPVLSLSSLHLTGLLQSRSVESLCSQSLN